MAMIVCCMPVFGPVLGQCRDTLYHQIGRCKDEESDLLGHSKTSSNDEKASNSLGASSVTYVQPGCSCEANPDPPAANKAEEGKDSSQSHLGALDIGNQPAARSGGIHVRTEITSGTSARGL